MNHAVQPPVRAVHADPNNPHAVRCELVVPAGHYFFQGHFPDVPLLPGVVQLTWAVELARQYLRVDGEFSGINALKFMRVIQPEQLVTLSLQFDVAAGKLYFEYRGDSGTCAAGTVRFDPRAAST
jgi:3-hydroxymyristoyl/3-hydroxydecanoyl-(acyl carrier protein) dehydratase